MKNNLKTYAFAGLLLLLSVVMLGVFTSCVEKTPEVKSLSWREYAYDDSSNISKITFYNSDSSIYGWEEYEYNNSNNVLKKIFYKSNNSVREWYEYEYDDFNNIIKQIHREFQDNNYADANMEYWCEYEYEYEYNINGNLVKELLFYRRKQSEHAPNRRLVEWSEYEYNDDGKIIKEKRYLSNGEVNQKCDYYYGDNGECLKIICHNSDGSLAYWEEFEYDGMYCKTHAKFYADGTMYDKQIYEYDNKNNIISQTSYEYDSTEHKMVMARKFLYEYDEKNRCIKEIRYTYIEPFVYFRES